MASAAAVEASRSAPRLPNDDLDDSDADITAKVTFGEDDDEDDSSPRRTVEENGENGVDEDEDEDDLFGDGGDDDDEEAPKIRKLDDEELDSGDDEGRTDRVLDDGDEEAEEVEQRLTYMEADIARHPIPEPSDNELYLFKVPRFLGIEPTVWNHKNFQPPVTDHHSKGTPSDTFSAFNTAMSTIRWRHSPSNPSELQSNARILRWSDGSLTLQFAHDPLNQYEINANELAPPQHNPKKPTPTSITYKQGRAPAGANDHKESYTYLAAPYEQASVMRITNKLTTALSVVATGEKDAALEQLQNAMAAAASRGREEGDNAITFFNVNEDPEVQKMKAEAAHKEKMRQQRSREKQQERERERANRTLGRSGIRSMGLSATALEDDDGRRGGPKKPRQRASRRDWSDEEEDYIRSGHTREDEYDEEDDFIAGSDEEEIVSDDEDEDDGIIEPPRGGRRDTESPKRDRGGDDEDDDTVAAVSRTKRRRVIDEDEDEE